MDGESVNTCVDNEEEENVKSVVVDTDNVEKKVAVPKRIDVLVTVRVGKAVECGVSVPHRVEV